LAKTSLKLGKSPVHDAENTVGARPSLIARTDDLPPEPGH